MTVWVKDNGSEIELNDEPATVKYAEDAGWARKDKPRRGRKPKVKE